MITCLPVDLGMGIQYPLREYIISVNSFMVHINNFRSSH